MLVHQRVYTYMFQQILPKFPVESFEALKKDAVTPSGLVLGPAAASVPGEGTGRKMIP